MYVSEKTLEEFAIERNEKVGTLIEEFSYKNDVNYRLVVPGLSVQVRISPEEFAARISNQVYFMVMNVWFWMAAQPAKVSEVIESKADKIINAVGIGKQRMVNTFQMIVSHLDMANFVLQYKAKRLVTNLWSQWVLDPIALLFWKGYELAGPAYKLLFVIDDYDYRQEV